MAVIAKPTLSGGAIEKTRESGFDPLEAGRTRHEGINFPAALQEKNTFCPPRNILRDLAS